MVPLLKRTTLSLRYSIRSAVSSPFAVSVAARKLRFCAAGTHGTYFMVSVNIETVRANHGKSMLRQEDPGSRSDYVEIWSHDRNLGCRQNPQRVKYRR